MESEWPKGRTVAGWCAIAFAVLQLAIFALVAPDVLPPLGASASSVATYFAAHKMNFLIGNYLGVLGVAPGVVTVAYLAALFRKREEDGGFIWLLVLSAGLVAMAVACFVLIAFQAVPFLAGPGLEAAAKALSDLSEAAFALLFVPIGLFAIAVACATRATGALPRWVAITAIVIAAVSFAVSLGSIWTSPFLGAGGPLNSLGLVLFSTWFGALARPLMRRT